MFKIFKILIIALLFAGLFALFFLAGKEKFEISAETPALVSLDFLNWYHKQTIKPKPGEKYKSINTSQILNSQYLNNNFKKQLVEFQKLQESDFYDLIICSNNYPNNFEILEETSSEENKDEIAIVKIKENFADISKNKEFIIKLKQENNKWLIDTIKCPAEELKIAQEKLNTKDKKEIENKKTTSLSKTEKEGTTTEIKITNEKSLEITKNEPTKKNTQEISIKNKLVSWGYQNSNNRNIDTIIIHSSYDALGKEPYNVSGLIKEYQEYSVAAHYLIDRQGIIYQLVEDQNIAYHAGKSQMPDGRTGVNNFSLGIELMNTETDNYEKEQYSSLIKLIKYLKNKHSIKYILGHNEIAPERKTDPWNFNWDKL